MDDLTTCSTYSTFHHSLFEDIYAFCLIRTESDVNALTITNNAFDLLREQWDMFASTEERTAFLIKTANKNCDDHFEQLRRDAVEKMIEFMSVN